MSQKPATIMMSPVQDERLPNKHGACKVLMEGGKVLKTPKLIEPKDHFEMRLTSTALRPSGRPRKFDRSMGRETGDDEHTIVMGR